MSDRTRAVQKYQVTFEIELYAGSTGEALARGCELARTVTQNLDLKRLAELVEGDSLPTGGVDGEPHGGTLDGWRCLWTITRP